MTRSLPVDCTVHGRPPSCFLRAEIIRTVRAVCGSLKKGGSIGVAFLSEAEMERVNTAYRRVRRPTDVLSFGYGATSFANDVMKNMLEGDVQICAPYVRRQALERGIPYAEELARVLIHGVLHIAGYDHATDAEEKRMFSLQEKVLNSL